MRAQIELMSKGFYKGPIDGKMSADFRNALRAFQSSQKLTESGNMDNATLSKLGIVY